jgi:CRISPR/Cas system-associated protein Csm6
MKQLVSEKHLVVILFVLVIITFSFADRDSHKIDQLYSSTTQNSRMFEKVKAEYLAQVKITRTSVKLNN